MNWLRKQFARLAFKAAGFPAARSLSLTDPNGWGTWGERTYAGKNVDENSALQVSAVWGCVRILAETIGCLPWALYERDAKGNAQRVDDHPLAELLVSPNADQTGVEFREATITNLGLRGNGYSVIDRTGSGRLVSLNPREACHVNTKQEKSGRIYHEVNENGDTRKYEQDRVWHLKTFSRNGITGLSPIGYARETMGFAMGLEEFGSKIFANGLLSGSVIEFPSWIPDDKRLMVEEKLQRMSTGWAHAGKPFLAEGGMKVSQGMLPPEDAQFLELRSFGVDEICRIYRVPPHMVAKLDRATFSNIEQQSLDFVMYTILPYLTRIEQSMSKWLLDAKDRKRLFVRFNFEGLLRADSAARASLYSIMLQNGVLTRNEVRALENRNRLEVEGMDEPTVQSNMALLDQLAVLVAAKGQPPAERITP